MIQDELRKLQEWALTGIRLTELPSVDDYGNDESDLALLRYCYYRLLYHVAGNIMQKPNYELHEKVDIILTAPFGECISKDVIIALCEVMMSEGFHYVYCKGLLFPKNWTADDVAGTICSLKGGSKELLESAIQDKEQFLSHCKS